MDNSSISGRQIAAARALAKVSQADLASDANISVPTLKRMEASTGTAAEGLANNVLAVRAALEARGIQFISPGDDASGYGVALK